MEHKIIGIRPGKKLHEQMISAEDSRGIPMNMINILRFCLKLKLVFR